MIGKNQLKVNLKYIVNTVKPLFSIIGADDLNFHLMIKIEKL